MSGQQVGSVVGYVVGAYIGGPVGGQIGAAVGGYVGGVIDPTIIKGPSIGDAQQQTSQAGMAIPKCYGHTPPLAPTLIDGDKLARKITITTDNGKGSTSKTESEGFVATRAFLVCEGEIAAFARINRNGKLVYSSPSLATTSTPTARRSHRSCACTTEARHKALIRHWKPSTVLATRRTTEAEPTSLLSMMTRHRPAVQPISTGSRSSLLARWRTTAQRMT